MFETTPNPDLRRRLVVLASGLALTVSLIGTYLALSSEQSDTHDAAPAAPSARPGRMSPSIDASTAGTRRLSGISDPEAFTDAVAHALFDWDTTAPIPLSEYAGRLLAVADPTGAESAGLLADVTAYLPTDEAWADLKPYYTRQWIEIESIAVAGLWPQAVEEAGSGGFAPGTTAYTIEGVRHRAGIWEGEDVSSAHDVAFTVFMVCGPTYPTCHLLRLSRLDEPLE